MPETPAQPRPSRWRWLSPAITLVLLALFAWYGYARITTPPAAGWDATENDAPARTQVDLTLLPPAPVAPSQNQADPNALLCRFRRADALPDYLVEYLAEARPVLAAARAAVAPEKTPGGRLARGPRSGQIALAPDDPGFRFLQTVAARMEQAAGEGDYRTSMELARLLNAGLELGQYNGWRQRSLPTLESAIGIVLQRYAVPAADSAVLVEDLQTDDGLRLSEYLLRSWKLDGDHEALLDRHYTRDEHGNGWLVVTSMGQNVFGVEGDPSRGWNLLSGCFYTRAEMRERLHQQVARFRRLDEPPVTRLLQDDAYMTQTSYTPLSGPLAQATASLGYSEAIEAMHTVNRRRVLVVLADLSAQRAAHGEYPQHADMSAWPLDLETGLPFRYQRDPTGDRYLLRRTDHQFWRIRGRPWMRTQHNPPLPEHKQ